MNAIEGYDTVQFPYHNDNVIVFLPKRGGKARIFSLTFDAEYPSFKALIQDCYDYAQFGIAWAKGNQS